MAMNQEKKSIVYVVQKQMRFDNKSGELVPRFDLDPASKFGEFKYLLSPTASPFKVDSILKDLKRSLQEYTSNDWLLLIGNPCLIGWAVSLAAHYNGGQVNLLQWSGKDQSYLPVQGQLYD